jgi:hypothetical protein
MIRSQILTITLLSGLFISGCDPTETTMFNERTYPATENVTIFRDTLPTQPYDEIGRIDNSNSIEDIVKTAKAHGADGLIKIETYQDPRIIHGIPHSDLNGEVYFDKKLRAIMIKFKNP